MKIILSVRIFLVASFFASMGFSTGAVASDADLPTGDWMMHYDWNCTGDPLETPYKILSDHTYENTKDGYTGKWKYDPQTRIYTDVADKWPHPTYRGTFDGKNTITGTMRVRELAGCFQLVYENPF